MLNHGIIMESRTCRLRPMLDADEDQVIELWNQDFVIGTLFASKTTPVIYRKYFNAYKVDPNQWRWVIESKSGKFIGTTGFDRRDDYIVPGYFAMYPTEEFLPIIPGILMKMLIYADPPDPRIVGITHSRFTVSPTNDKIKKLHKFFRHYDTGDRDVVVSSQGIRAEREHWRGDKETWLKHREFYMSFL